MDGKTGKQGHDADGDPIHVLNVFAHEARIRLAQWAVGDGKATEPEVLKAHLGEPFAAYPALRLLTGDALFRRPGSSSRPAAITCSRSKTTGPTRTRPRERPSPTRRRRRPTPGRGKKGGAVVTRRLWLDLETADYARRTLSFPGPRLLPRVDGETRGVGADPKTGTRYFAAGSDPGGVTPDELLAAVRGHRQVENGLHFIKDRRWDEDRHYSTRPQVALGFAAPLNAVVTVPRTSADPEDERPPRARADALAWDVEQAIDLMVGKKL